MDKDLRKYLLAAPLGRVAANKSFSCILFLQFEIYFFTGFDGLVNGVNYF
jgi:hypothetical protein